ncbi:coagulogen-like [Tachypleus tridentatus]|uniref:coagulogen-like n=1 Tax=Tachypleus tridentatus TaxID=6853 RepID=UPI003FD00061
MEKICIFILFGMLMVASSGDINAPICLCDEPENIGIIGRKQEVSSEVQAKIENDLEQALKLNGTEQDEASISGRGNSRLWRILQLSNACGTHTCRFGSNIHRCDYLPPFINDCDVTVKKCTPRFAYNTHGNLKIIVQAPIAGFTQCLWQYKCRYGPQECGLGGNVCTQNRQPVRLLSFDLETQNFYCEDFYQCCGCPCGH